MFFTRIETEHENYIYVRAGQKTSLKLNEERLQYHKTLMQRYVKSGGELELQCLYAIQSLIHKLEHPQGKLHYRAVISRAVSCGLRPGTRHSKYTMVTFYARDVKYS